MKILCDVHIAKKVVRFFQEQGIESVHVNDILDSWFTKDESIKYNPVCFERKEEY